MAAPETELSMALASATETVRTPIARSSAWTSGHWGLPGPNAGVMPSTASLSSTFEGAAESVARARTRTSRLRDARC